MSGRRTFLAHRCRSRFNRSSPIAVVAIEASGTSGNRKTGEMLALAVLPDLAASDAAGDGRRPDESCCPADCPYARRGRSGWGGCYVNWGIGVSASLSTACMLEADPQRAIDAARGAMVRLGERGDPAAVGVAFWRQVLADARGWTGYTHDWRNRRTQPLRAFAMASVESPAQREHAKRLGWRTYRQVVPGAPVLPGEIRCPAQTHGITCGACGLCSGSTGRGARAPDIAAEVHGGAVAARVSRRYVASLASDT